MGRHLRWVVAGTLLAVLAGTCGVYAEIASEIDGNGNYLRMIVMSNASGKNPRIWDARKPHPAHVPLNPEGDKQGDLWPLILENPYDHNHPFVIWSRMNDTEYDLAWSRWDGGSWTEISWVEESTATIGDDMEPSGNIDYDGRPYLAWWRDEDGVGRVYMSLYLSTRWMGAFPVSDLGVDSRHPIIHIADNGHIQIDYETPEGPQTTTVIFDRPHTITDELNPFEAMRISEEPTDTSQEMTN